MAVLVAEATEVADIAEEVGMSRCGLLVTMETLWVILDV